MRTLFYCVLLLVVGSCAQPNEGPGTRGVAVSQTCADTMRVPSAGFPSVPDWPELGDILRQRYSRFLTQLNEPSLWCGSAPDESYRFVWERFLSPAIVSVRVARMGDAYFAEAAVVGGNGVAPDWDDVRRVSKSLSDSEWRRLRTEIATIQFWSAETSVDDLDGNDGAVFRIEARRDGRYHSAARWGGVDGFCELGETFADIVGITREIPRMHCADFRRDPNSGLIAPG